MGERCQALLPCEAQHVHQNHHHDCFGRFVYALGKGACRFLRLHDGKRGEPRRIKLSNYIKHTSLYIQSKSYVHSTNSCIQKDTFDFSGVGLEELIFGLPSQA